MHIYAHIRYIHVHVDTQIHIGWDRKAENQKVETERQRYKERQKKCFSVLMDFFPRRKDPLINSSIFTYPFVHSLIHC